MQPRTKEIQEIFDGLQDWLPLAFRLHGRFTLALMTAAADSVRLTTKTDAADKQAIACTLTPGSVKDRLDEWRELLTHVEHREVIEGGVRSVFAPTVPTDVLIRLVTAEQDCCRFFQFAITVDARGIALEVRAPAEAYALVESVFGFAR